MFSRNLIIILSSFFLHAFIFSFAQMHAVLSPHFVSMGKLYGHSKESHALNILWLMGCLFDILGSRKTFSFLNYVLSFARALRLFPFIPYSYQFYSLAILPHSVSMVTCVCVCVSRLLAPFIHKIFILHPSSEDGFYERENAVVACDNKSNNFAHCTATQHIPYRSVCCWVSSVALGHFICATPTEIHRINIVPIFFYERKRNFIQNIVSKFNQRKLIFFVHFISKKKKKIAR